MSNFGQNAAILVNPLTGEEYNLVRFSNSVGREIGNDIVLATDRTVSRQHALVQYINGSFYLEDLGSKNGTRLNGKKIADRALLVPGDEISAGVSRLIFLLVPSAQQRQAEHVGAPRTETLADPVVPNSLQHAK